MLVWMLVVQTLTLEQAWNLALQGPQWKAMKEELALREAESMEGIFWENPSFALEVEEAPRTGFTQGLQTLRFSWALPLSPSTWFARKGLRLTREQNAWLEQAMMASFRAEVTRRFIAAHLARKRLKIEETRLAILDTLLEYTKRRLRKGRSHPAELARMKVRRDRQEVIIEEAHVAIVQADQELLELFPEGTAFDSLALTFTLPAPDDTLLTSLRERLARSPQIRSLETEIQRQKALERRAAWAVLPNPEIEGGPQRGPEGDFISLGLGFSIPLFERNQGERAFRKARLRQVQYEVQAVRIQLDRRLQAAWEAFRHAWTHRNRLRSSILPALEEAYRSYEQGYLRGRFDLTTLLDAQADLLEAHLQALEVEEKAWEAWLQIYEILGQKEVWP